MLRLRETEGRFHLSYGGGAGLRADRTAIRTIFEPGFFGNGQVKGAASEGYCET